MSGGVYLIQEEDQLVEMAEKPYDSEALLQELLESNPGLLAVNRREGAALKPWLLVRRNVTNTTEDTISERWSLNHLFLDQQATPTLVEVKSSDDSGVRRAAIGQMLDYAANASVYWPVESILTQFEANCRDQNRDPEDVFESFLGINADEEKFWQQVKTNFQAGKVRLIFVADHISAELQRVVEFLNKQMDPAEILALEIKQYASQNNDLKTLVCKVIGQTAEAQQRKTRTTLDRRQWDENSFFAEYEIRYGKDEADIAKKIYLWAINQEPNMVVQWVTGDAYGGFAVKLTCPGKKESKLFFVGIDGALEISSDAYADLPPFDHQNEWLELRNQLSSIGLALPTEPSQRRLPNFLLSTLPEGENLTQVLTTFDWVVNRVNC